MKTILPAMFITGLAICGIAIAQPPASPGTANQPVSVAESLPPPAPMPGTVAAPDGSNLSRQDFIKGVYVDAIGPALKSPESIKKLVQDCRSVGFDTLFVQVRSMGDAYYESKVVPKASGLASGFDPLKTLLAEARSGGPRLKVHAMLVVFRVGSKDLQLPEGHVAIAHRDWLTQNDAGSQNVGDNNVELWLDPAVTEAQDHVALVAADLVRNYEVDGLQLDRIRYPDTSLKCGYNPKAVERFNKEKNRTGDPKFDDSDWTAWRRDQVTENVRKTREAVRAARPGVVFSASAITYGTPPANMEGFRKDSAAYVRALEDWAGWCESGLIDMTCLMNYKAAADRAAEFEGWSRFALENKGKAKVVVAVGGWLNPSRHSAAMMLMPVFDPRADGVALYSYHQPASSPENADAAFAIFRQAFQKETLDAKAKELAAIVSQNMPSITKLDQLSIQLTGSAPAPAAAPANEPAASAAQIPLLATAQPPAGMPNLGAASAGTAAPLSDLPSLGNALTGSAPSQPRSDLPSLSAAASMAPGSPADTAKAPAGGSLPNLSSGMEAAPGGMSTLPTLGQGSAPDALPVASGLPALGQPSQPTDAPPVSGVPVLPALSQLNAPALATPAGEVALPPLGQQAPSIPAMPGAMPSLNQPREDASAPSTLPNEPAVALPPATVSSFTHGSSQDFAKQLNAMNVPSAETRGSVNIPGNIGETNFIGSAVATPMPVVPAYVAPSVLTPAPGEKPAPKYEPVAVSTLLPQPKKADYSNNDSPFFRRTPEPRIRSYAPGSGETDNSFTAPSVSGLDVIVLKNGRQFTGKVLEQGAMWKIQLPNGSAISIPGDKVATTKPAGGSGTAPGVN